MKILLSFYTIIILILTSAFIAIFIYLIFHRIGFKNVFKGIKQYNRQKYGFYECGFRPKQELSITFTLQSYIMCSLVILYDIEGVFLLIFLLNLNFLCLFDFLFILFYLFLLFFGFAFESYTKTTEWHFY